MNRPWPQALVLAALVLATWVAAAQTAAAPGGTPDTRSMIEALLPSSTRSLRTLVVERAPPSADGAASAASGAVRTEPAAVPVAAEPPAGPPPNLSLAIQFESNSSRVRAESGALLGSLVAAMQSPELKASRFVIEGHADARGAAAQNQRLSQERADEVRLYLVALGVHPSRLRAVGRGASQLANAGDPSAAENRRVRVVTVE